MSTPDTPGHPRRRSWPDVLRIVVTIILGGIGAAAGFKHTHDWALAHGQTGWLAWADAVVIEGIAVVAGFEIHRDHHSGRTPRRVSFPMIVLVAGFGIQMAAQVALAEPTPAGWLLAAMPALGFLVVVKLLMRRAPAPEAPVEPLPAAAAEVSPEPAPSSAPPSVERPRVRLSREITDKIAAAAAEIRDHEGREPTTTDIRRAVKVPDHLAAQALREIPAHNGHPRT